MTGVSPTLAETPVAETPVAVKPEIELTQENCPALFQKLLKTLGLTISAGLKHASGLQLGSEDRLEILLDSTSEFARKALDQTDNRSRIEAEILRLTGRTVSIALRLTAPKTSPSKATITDPSPTGPMAEKVPDRSAPSNSRSPQTEVSPPPTPALRNLMGEVDPSSDVFVRDVMKVFGATVVRITAAPAVQAASTESDDAEE